MGEAARKASEKYAIEKTTQFMLTRYDKLLADFAPHRRGIGYRFRNLVERLRA